MITPNEKLELVEVLGKQALFTSLRVEQADVPEGLYRYDIRHDDECQGIACEIAKYIMVNHWGTILIDEKLDLGPNGRIYLDELVEDDQINYIGYMSVGDYLNRNKNN